MNSNQTRSLTSWSKGVPILPPELIDNIIDELSGDSRSLKACSLVTKSWTYSSQCHLFRCLKVGLTGIQDTDRDGRLDEFRRFLLSSPYPRSSIRELRIFCPPNVKAFVLTSEIALLLHYTPSLRRLHLQGINLRTTSEGDFNEAPTLNHRTLRVLEISGFQGSFWSFGSRCLFDLLRWLPQLEDLRIRMGALLNAPNCSQTQSLDVVGMDQHVQYIRVPSSVRSLHLKTFHFDSPLSRPFLTDALRKTGCAGSLTSITVGLSSIDEIVTSGRLIRDVGPRLLHLRLNLIDSGISRNNINGRTQQGALDSLQLHRCTSLKSIRLDLPNGCDLRIVGGKKTFHPAHHWSFCFSILRSFDSPSYRLRFVTIVLMDRPTYSSSRYIVMPSRLQEIDWEGLDRSLSSLPVLERVRIFAEDRWGLASRALAPSTAKNVVEAVLPSIVQKGVSVSLGPEWPRS